MRNFLIGFFTGIALLALFAASSAYLFLRAPERPPKVRAGSTLVLRLSGDIPEKRQFTWPGTAPASLAMFDVWDVLRKAAVDDRIRGLVLAPEGIATGWAKLAEIRSSLEAFRKSGKPVAALLRSPSARDYYLATAAPKISIPPGDVLNLKGLRAELLYARRGLDKLGIVPEFEAIGKYKDGPDTLTRTAMPETTLQVMNELLDARFADLTETIAKGRGKKPDDVRALIDQGPFLAGDALRSGLVDALQYEDEVLPAASDETRIDAIDYQRLPALAVRLSGPDRIAFLVAEGDILRSPVPGVADDVISPRAFAKSVRAAKDDDRVKAVILRIDSPGGDAIASDEILRELKLLAAKKPVVVSMSDVAASGGYAIALAGAEIVAYPQTITGSIGIFFGKLDLTGLYDKLGVTKQVLTRGKFAAIDSDAHLLTAEERAKLRTSLEQMYQTFVKQVAEGRRRKPEEIAAVAEGRVWLGSQAARNGLVDGLGGIDEAMVRAKKRAGIRESNQVEIVVYPKRPDVWQMLESQPWKLVWTRPALPPLAGAWKRLPMVVTVE